METGTVAARLLDEIQAAGKLPTPPGVLLRLLDICRDPGVSAKQLADTITLDPGLSAKILRFVNSPLAGLRSKVGSLQQAVALMGVRSVKMMALSFSALAREGKSACSGFDQETFALQSLGCAHAARRISEKLALENTPDAFAAGLLSQIGRSIFAGACAKRYAPLLARAESVPADLPTLEMTEFGESYATLGGQALRAWGLPEELCSAVGRFRDQDDCGDGCGLAQVLRAAELAACVVCPAGPSRGRSLDVFLEYCSRHLKLGRTACGEVLEETARELEFARKMFEIPAGKLRAPCEIETDVRERITELSIAMHMENQSLAMQQADLLRRATTDGLTGVGNRAAFDARLALETQRSARSGAPLGLLMIDVDKFKSINDTHGHLAGDRVLQTVARVLDENIRKVDYCARYGGEEFAIIAPANELAGLAHVAERLREGVQSAVTHFEDTAIRVTISVGAALAGQLTDAAEMTRELTKTADRFLYEAKCSGRNRVVCGPCGGA